MRRHPLRVEQREAARAQALDQRRQRDLRRVGHAVEHRLAEERAAERHAVQPAGQLAVLPASTECASPAVQRDVAVDDLLADPGARIVRIAIGFRAGTDDGLEVAIDVDLEAALTPDSREAAGDVKCSSGMMPRGSGENQRISPPSTAIGNQPLA